MIERQEKKRRYNQKLEWISNFEKWLASEPPIWKLFAWRRWKNSRPAVCHSAVPITNADYIRAMSNLELAKFLDDAQRKECESLHMLESDGTFRFESCVNGWLYWLGQEVDND